MAREVHLFSVTVPAGTPKSAPLAFNLNMPPRIVQLIDVEVPPGPRGEVGFSIGQAGNAIFPYEPGAFIVTDDRVVEIPLEDANTSGSWQVFAYNTGSFPHTLYVRFFCDLTTDTSTTSTLDVIPNDVLSS